MRILVSTSDKTGLIEFLKPFMGPGLEVVSTGGTYEYLKKNGFSPIEVSQVTGFPEVLDGRVKTLHPMIHMGLLADKYNAEHMQQMNEKKVAAFDMVIGNLYPFEKTALKDGVGLDELIENIDIGGPSFLRASAKNYRSVIVICMPTDYEWVQAKILENKLTDEDRKTLALKVFSLTSYYDALIVHRLATGNENFEFLNLPLKLKQKLRYGENPQQTATWYANPLSSHSIADAHFHQGKELSYNNLLDLDAASGLVGLFERPGCVAVKHNNPCGAAVADTVFQAAIKAIQSDPKSIFGGIVAFNRPVDEETAKAFKDIFLECVIAPEFSESALKVFAAKKNLRVLTLKSLLSSGAGEAGLKSISGGLLVQEADSFSTESWEFISDKPGDQLYKSMVFGEKVCAALKSNAIAVVENEQTIGLGMGQVNRVDAVHHALTRMRDYMSRQNIKTENAVLVSDAFFPFADSIELIAEAGIRWILQPGGSVQDQNVIDAAKSKNINMVLTKRRHFKH